MNSEEIEAGVRGLWQTYKHLPWKERSSQIGPREADMMVKWVSYLTETYGEGISPLALVQIYSKAWQDRHSEGYRAVEYGFEELCEFFRQLRELDSQTISE